MVIEIEGEEINLGVCDMVAEPNDKADGVYSALLVITILA